jgi:hypothetical protein
MHSTPTPTAKGKRKQNKELNQTWVFINQIWAPQRMLEPRFFIVIENIWPENFIEGDG